MTASRTRHTDAVDHEIVVVGARCAGAATALLLARQGHDVLVVDRATFPSDTLSTHALSRGGVVQLARWGLLDAVVASGAPRIRDVRFRLPDGTVLEKVVKDRSGVDFLLAPRRYVLDALLVDAAVDAGARLATGVSVTDTIVDTTGRVAGVTLRDAAGAEREIRARFVVGADGLHSRVARAVGARVVEERPSDAAVQYAYVAGLDARGFEFHLGERLFAGVFPTHDGEANVWACTHADDAVFGTGGRTEALMALLDRTSPPLAERVRAARITSPVRAAVRYPNQVREAAGPGWALVGDAAYHRDPITGHGITDAFRDAELLARGLGRALRGEATERDALGRYETDRREALAEIFDVTCRLAAFPPADEFSALQKQLSVLIDAEASWLASLPSLGRYDRAAA